MLLLPYQKNGGNKMELKDISAKVSSEMKERLARYARGNFISESAVIRQALNEFLPLLKEFEKK
jgi:predicted transcriptional regulator